jgi:dihydroorotate dehydrogenase
MSFFYEKLVRPLLFALSPESAHDAGMLALRRLVGAESVQNLAASRFCENDEILRTRLFGLDFANPLGMAAGFDKNGRVVDQLAALGFGFVEVGTVTFHPQPGNERPRLFRLPADEALINRFGFNNDGASAVVERLRHIRRKCVVGVNIGRNKEVANDDAIANYLSSYDIAAEVADYIAVNVSSPNTPGLRDLQREESLRELLTALRHRNTKSRIPLLVKIAPDLADGEIESIAAAAVEIGLDGIIATNTTIDRSQLRIKTGEAGGLSGKPLKNRSTEVVARIYGVTNGKLPIIGVGGIFSGEDAYEKIAAGSSLVQAYTGFVYAGPYFARDVNKRLAEILRERGFCSVAEAVGSASKETFV